MNCTTVIHITDEVNLKLKQIYVNRTIEKSLSLEVVLHQTGKKTSYYIKHKNNHQLFLYVSLSIEQKAADIIMRVLLKDKTSKSKQ